MIGPSNPLTPTANPVPIDTQGRPTPQFQIPSGLPPALHDFLKDVSAVTPIRDTTAFNLIQQHNSTDVDIAQQYRPAGTKDDFWQATKGLLLHINTTRIAVRALMGTYAGTQSRSVVALDNDDLSTAIAQEVHDYAQSHAYKRRVALHFRNAILAGTSILLPRYDVSNGTLSSLLMDPSRLRVSVPPADVEDVQGVADFQDSGRVLRFHHRLGSGTLIAGVTPTYTTLDTDDPAAITIYPQELPFCLAQISYGEDRRPEGNPYGRSAVAATPEYNRILTQAYYALSLLIKWQARSILLLSSETELNQDSLPMKLENVAGQVAILMGKGGKGEFIHPMPKFGEILDVVHSYMSFLAVLLGLPRSVFTPQDNQSAEAARLEGAPMASILRQHSDDAEAAETEMLWKVLAFQHLRRNQILTMAQLRKRYAVNVVISPHDWSGDINSSAASIVQLVQSGLLSIRDGIRRVNPGLSDAEVESRVVEAQARLLERIQTTTADTPPPAP